MAPPYQSDDFDENSISGSTDVKLTNLANSEVLAWNATNSKWENATNGGGGGVAQNLQQVLTPLLARTPLLAPASSGVR